MVPKSVVPVRDFQPDLRLRISSAYVNNMSTPAKKKTADAHSGDADVGGHVRVVRHATGFVGVVEYEAGIDGPGARCAWEAIKRRQAHRGVEGLSVLHSACRRAGAKVQDDEVQRLRRLLEKLGNRTQNKCICRIVSFGQGKELAKTYSLDHGIRIS